MNWELFSVNDFANWTTHWQKLNEQLAGNLPVLEPAFVSGLIECFSAGNELLAVGTIGKKISAMAIIKPNSRFSWQTYQPSQAPVGLWLCPANLQQQALKSLIKKIPGFILKIDVLQQDPSVLPQSELKSDNIEFLDYITTGHLVIKDNFDAYFASLGKNQRQNYNKANNRLKKQNTNVELIIETRPESMHKSVEEYGIIESSSWKNDLGTAVNINNQQGKFYALIMTDFAKRDMAEAWKYYYDDQLVAIDLCIKNAEQLIILKTTFESNYSRFSPAINMKIDAIKTIYKNQSIERIEYFGKMLDWHKRLNSEGRIMYHFSYYKNPALLSLKKLIRRSYVGT